VRKPKTAIAGILILVIGGVIAGMIFLRPAEKTAQTEPAELTGEMEPQIELVQVLEDSEVPSDLPSLKVAGSEIYLLVTIFYPGLPVVPEPMGHRIDNINGNPRSHAAALVVNSDSDEDGARADLFFLVGDDFETARLVRGSKVIAARIELD